MQFSRAPDGKRHARISVTWYFELFGLPLCPLLKMTNQALAVYHLAHKPLLLPCYDLVIIGHGHVDRSFTAISLVYNQMSLFDNAICTC